jgi:hypothetical protein
MVLIKGFSALNVQDYVKQAAYALKLPQILARNHVLLDFSA